MLVPRISLQKWGLWIIWLTLTFQVFFLVFSHLEMRTEKSPFGTGAPTRLFPPGRPTTMCAFLCFGIRMKSRGWFLVDGTMWSRCGFDGKRWNDGISDHLFFFEGTCVNQQIEITICDKFLHDRHSGHGLKKWKIFKKLILSELTMIKRCFGMELNVWVEMR